MSSRYGTRHSSMTRWRSAAVAHRPGDLDPAEHVAAHPVGARQVDRLVVVAVAPAEIGDARVLEEAADDRAHADAIGDASMPGGSMQAPRTIRSICAPAWPASTSASIRAWSVSALILTTMRAVSPGRRRLGDPRDAGEHLLVQRERRLQQRLQRPGAAEAGELLEHGVDVGGQIGVVAEVAEVGVEARRVRVVVAGREMRVALQAAALRAASRAAAWRASSGRRRRRRPARRPPRAARPS